MFSYRMRTPAGLVLIIVSIMAAVLLFGLTVNALFAQDPDQAMQAEPTQAAEDGHSNQAIVTTTLLPVPESTSGLQQDPDTGTATLEVIKKESTIPATFNGVSAQPQILIYHTHSQEAYTIVNGAEYVEAAKWRTADNLNNILRIGSTLAYFLENQYGWGVLHDQTDYEMPQLSSAYGRSLEGMLAQQKEKPSLKVFIDVHRDAYNANNKPKFIEIDGKEAARILFVVGKGTDFAEQPQWELNKALAESICEKLNAIHPEFCRGVSVKDQRYNQHVSDQCLLIEVGHNENTLEQAMNSIPYLAQAIDEALKEMS